MFVDTGEIKAVVLDNGSCTTKAGFSGDDHPTYCCPTVLCWNSNRSVKIVGQEAITKYKTQPPSLSPQFSIKSPIQNSFVVDWDAMESIWHHVFYNGLKIAPEEHPVLLTEVAKNPKACREKMIQIMFETFNVPALHVSPQSLLSLYAKGVTSGLVVDIGDGSCKVVPVQEGCVVDGGVVDSGMSGVAITRYLRDLLRLRGVDIEDLETVRCIKERHATVLPSPFSPRDPLPSERLHQSPDGQLLPVGPEKFLCAEILFQPSLVQSEAKGISQLAFEALLKESPLVAKGGVHLAGGTTLCTGFARRFTTELQDLLLRHHQGAGVGDGRGGVDVGVVVSAPRGRDVSAWVGGSWLTSLSVFQQVWTSKEEYDEGPFIPRRRRVW